MAIAAPECSGSESAVSATVAGCSVGRRRAEGIDFLREVRQRVVFGQDADDRLASAVARDERRGHVAQPGLHFKASGLEFLDEQRGRAALFQADFSELPNRFVDRLELRLKSRDFLESGPL